MLAGGAVFTGVGEDVSRYSMTTCFVFSDVASAATATTGMSLQQSTDGTNWDRKTVIHIDAGESEEPPLTISAKFFRVVYTNGSAAQTEFRLQCRHHKYQSRPPTAFATEIVHDHHSTVITRAVGSFAIDVSRGLIEDHSWALISGRNGAISGTEETVWETGGNYTGFGTTAVTLEILSDDANDTSAGTGARTVKVTGRDISGDAKTTTATMNGTSVVSLGAGWFRVLEIEVVTSGVYATTAPATGSNIGLVTVRVASGGAIYGQIIAENGRSELGIYHVETGTRAYLRRVNIDVSTGANKTADVFFWKRDNATTVSAPFSPRILLHEWDDLSGDVPEPFSFSEVFEADTDLWWTAIGDTASEIDITYELLIVPNETLPAIP